MLIVDLQYFPPVSFFSTSYNFSNVRINEYERFRKMGFFNRCLIAGANNIIGLSIPLAGGRQQRASLREIRIAETEPWQKQHWRSIRSAYNRSPFFEHYAGELESLYRQKQIWLLDWNRSCLEWIRGKTGWRPGVIFCSAPLATDSPDPGKAREDSELRLQPKNYKSFPAPVYHQVFEDIHGFQANLSVLDLLFNTGPQAGEYLAATAGDAP